MKAKSDIANCELIIANCKMTGMRRQTDRVASLPIRNLQFAIILRAGEIDAIGGDSTVALSLRRQVVPSAERQDYSKSKASITFDRARYINSQSLSFRHGRLMDGSCSS